MRLEDTIRDLEQIIIIDETQKSRDSSRRRHAWGMKGVTPVLPTYFEEDFRKRYTMIGASNISGFVKEACEIVERTADGGGTVDTERFEQYICECIVPILGRLEYDEKHSIVIMDNASIHLSAEVEKMIADAGALLILTAPYSPHLNPIEYFFSTYKAALGRLSYESCKHDWFSIHYEALGAVTPEAARKTFRHCKFPLATEFCARFNDEADEDCLAILLSVVIAATICIHVG